MEKTERHQSWCIDGCHKFWGTKEEPAHGKFVLRLIFAKSRQNVRNISSRLLMLNFFWTIFSYQRSWVAPQRQHWMGFCSCKWTPHVNQVYGENEYSTIREDRRRNMNFCLPFSHSLRSRHHWRKEGQQIHFWFEGYYRISSWICTKVYCYPNKTGFFVFLDILVRISLWPVENLRLRCHNGIGQVRCPFNSF